MVQIYVCSECGFELWRTGDTIKTAVTGPTDSVLLATPGEVRDHHNGKCPRCGHRLEFNPENIMLKRRLNTPKIMPLDEEEEDCGIT